MLDRVLKIGVQRVEILEVGVGVPRVLKSACTLWEGAEHGRVPTAEFLLPGSLLFW